MTKAHKVNDGEIPKFFVEGISATANSANSLPLVDSRATDSGSSVYRFIVTSALQNWYAGGNNNGLVITTTNESNNGQTTLYSTGAASSSNRPVLWFGYEPPGVSASSWDTDAQAAASNPITVTCGASWAAIPDQPWISISDITSSTFVISAAANTGLTARAGTVTVKTGNTVIGTIAVTQLGALPCLDVDQSNWLVDGQGGTETFQITSNTAWTIAADQSWLSVSAASGSGSASFTISAEPNAGTEIRAGSVTVQAGLLVQTIAVQQMGTEFNPETAMIYEAAAIGKAHFDSILNGIAFKYDPSINYGELLADDSFQLQFTAFVTPLDLSNLQNLSDALTTAGYSTNDVDLFVERWAVAFTRMDLMDIWEVVFTGRVDMETKAYFVPLTGQNEIEDLDGMIAAALNYYKGNTPYDFSRLMSDAIAQDTFGMDYAQALELYYDTQPWADFEETLNTYWYLTSFSCEWAVAFYLKNLAAMNGIFDKIGMVREAIGVGVFETLTGSYDSPFRYNPSKKYGDFWLGMTSATEIDTEFISIALASNMGDATKLRAALMNPTDFFASFFGDSEDSAEFFESYECSQQQADEFIQNMAKVFAHQSLYSVRDTIQQLFGSWGDFQTLYDMLTTPSLAADIEVMTMILVMYSIICFMEISEQVYSIVSYKNTFAEPVMMWIWAAYWHNFAAMNNIQIPPGVIAPDVYPIKNAQLKDELARSAIALAFAEIEEVDPELVAVDPVTMQTLVDAVMAQDFADFGMVLQGLLLRKGADATDILLLGLASLFLDSNSEELDVVAFADVLRTVRSFSDDEIVAEVIHFIELLSEENIDEYEEDFEAFIEPLARSVVSLTHYILESWEAIEKEVGALFGEEDDTLDHVLAWVTALYAQNLVALNAAESSMAKVGGAISKQERQERTEFVEQLVTDDQVDAVIDAFSLDNLAAYDIMDMDYVLDSRSRGEFDAEVYIEENDALREGLLEPVASTAAKVAASFADESSEEFAVARAALLSASGMQTRAGSGCGEGCVGGCIQSGAIFFVEVFRWIFGIFGIDCSEGCDSEGGLLGGNFSVDRNLWMPNDAYQPTTISITANQGTDWTATSNKNWLVVVTPSGSGNSYIQLYVLQNDTGVKREGTITIKHGLSSTQITVVQAGPPTTVTVYNECELRAALASAEPDRTINLGADIRLDGCDTSSCSKDVYGNLRYDSCSKASKDSWAAISVNKDRFILDGKGHTLTIDSAKEEPNACMCAGLLGNVASSNVTVQNLGVVGRLVAESSYNGYQLAQIRAGGLAARTSGGTFIVKNSYFTNDNEGVRATRDYRESSAIAVAGGFIGEITNKANVTITDCFVNGDVRANTMAALMPSTATSYAGGFVGLVKDNANLTFTRSYAAGTVDSRARKVIDLVIDHPSIHRYTGGLIGYESSPNVTAPSSYRCNKLLWIGSALPLCSENTTGIPKTLDEMRGSTVFDALNTNSKWTRTGKDSKWPILSSVKWSPVLDSVLLEIATTAESTTAYQTIANAAIQLAGFDVYYKDVIENKLLIRAEFDVCETYKYNPCVFQCWLNHIAPYAIAHKTLNKGTSDEETIVVIAIRGTGLEHDRLGCTNALLTDIEFGYNCFGWNHDEHRGFYTSALDIWNHLTEDDERSNGGQPMGYLDRHEIDLNDPNVKVLITGHSRGASVSNILSAMFYDECVAVDPQTQISQRVFGYCFATPPVIKKERQVPKNVLANYQNIFHIDNNQDKMIGLTKQNPVTGYEYECYGVPISFDGGGNEGWLDVVGMVSGGHRPERYQKWVYTGLGGKLE